MVRSFVCGTASFEEEEEEEPWPRRSRSTGDNHPRSKIKIKKKNKNPYSNRGLDKFATTLADLHERRTKIYEQLGSTDDSLVRFCYSNSREWVPIVVKLKEQRESNKDDAHADAGAHADAKKHATITETSESLTKIKSPDICKEVVQRVETQAKKRNFTLRKPQICLLAVLVLILLCLVMSGKSFAILCTSIWWYLMPIMKENPLRRAIKSKEYGRWLGERKVVVAADAAKPNMVVKKLQRGHSNKGW